MRFFARTRRPAIVIALAGLAMAGVVGFAHNFLPDPRGMTGGIAPVHQTDPTYDGGHAPGMTILARGIPGPGYTGGITPAA